jgi:hypothetical protein
VRPSRHRARTPGPSSSPPRRVYGELPEPSERSTPHTYTLDVGPATIFLPASFVEEDPEPRPEPKVRPMADLLAGA